MKIETGTHEDARTLSTKIDNSIVRLEGVKDTLKLLYGSEDIEPMASNSLDMLATVLDDEIEKLRACMQKWEKLRRQ